MMVRAVVALVVLAATLCAGEVRAAEASVTASLDRSSVGVGDAFTYVLEVVTDGADARVLDYGGLPEKFAQEGVSTSTSTSISFSGGGVRQQRSVTYMVRLRAGEVGTFRLKPSVVEVDGKRYSSNALEVSVLAAGSSPGPQPGAQGGGPQGGGGRQGAGPDPSADPFDPFGAVDPFTQPQRAPARESDVFVRMVVPKTEVYEGEGFVVSLYAYTAIPVANLNPRKPAFDGFWEEGLTVPQQARGSTQRVGNRMYNVYLVSRSVLFALRAGQVTIPAVEAEIETARGGFFRLGPGTVLRRRSEPIEMTVKALPEAGKPRGFDRSRVGKLVLTTEVEDVLPVAGKPLTVRVSLNGTGNLRNMALPKLPLSPDYKVYPPTASEELGPQRNGEFGGTRSADYLIVPLRDGEVVVPEIGFDYFDPSDGTYARSTAPALRLRVQPGTVDPALLAQQRSQAASAVGSATATAQSRGGAAGGAEAGGDAGQVVVGEAALKALRYPVRFVRAEKEPVHEKWFHWLVLVTPVLAGVLLAGVSLARRRREPESVRRQREQVAAWRVEVGALAAMTASEFAVAALRALHTLGEAATGEPVRALTHEALTTALTRGGLSGSEAEAVAWAIAWCEAARYAGGAGGAAAQGEEEERVRATLAMLLQRADARTRAQAVSRARGVGNGAGGDGGGNGGGGAVVGAVVALSLLAVQFVAGEALAENVDAGEAVAGGDVSDAALQAVLQEGVEAYLRGDYAVARGRFEQAVASGLGGADLYYNLGLARYRVGEAGRAVAAFERAVAEGAGDDAAFNLRLVLSELSQRFSDAIDGGDIAGYGFFVRAGGATTQWLFAVVYPLSFGLATVWLLAGKRRRARLLVPAIVVVAVAMLTGVLSAGRYYYSERAVPLTVGSREPVAVREGPHAGFAVAFYARPGARALGYEALDDHVRVRLPNGLTGWVARREVAWVLVPPF